MVLQHSSVRISLHQYVIAVGIIKVGISHQAVYAVLPCRLDWNS